MNKALAALLLAVAFPAAAQSVKITPLGSHDGEFCPLDRAMIFEDPDGTRILYDAGRTVRGANDPRLGKIDAILISHLHGDHLGDIHQPAANAGQCGKPDFSVVATPNSNSVNIALAKQAPLVVGGEMNFFLAAKVKSLGGDPGKLVRLVRFGASTMVGKVFIATVPAVHSNGLTAYLSGDTGITAEQDLLVRGYYKANLAVMNIGGFPFTTGPMEATHVVNEMVKPASVIASHANEAATVGGKLNPNSKTAAFQKSVSVPVYVPLSGKTMEFDGSGRCVSGC